MNLLVYIRVYMTISYVADRDLLVFLRPLIGVRSPVVAAAAAACSVLHERSQICTGKGADSLAHRPSDRQNLLPAMLCIKPSLPPSVRPPPAWVVEALQKFAIETLFASPSLSPFSQVGRAAEGGY